MLFLVFFCSGVGGLIYQVVWVRVFANVFGNTIYSASIVVAVFMLGLGVGSFAGGVWADRRYRARPESLLQVFAGCEAAIGLLALGLSQLLPHLGDLSARMSSYARDQTGWYVLSVASYAGRAAIAVVLLAPITVLMGATLSLLIRHVVRRDVQADSWRVAALYGANTLGAAWGCLLTDLALVPAYGIRGTQLIAVGFNLAAAAGAFRLAARATSASAVRSAPSRHPAAESRTPNPESRTPNPVPWACFALALAGFAAMGLEIVWFRHFSILLGEYRAVFATVLGVILLGIGAGAFLGVAICRRAWQPAHALMAVQGLMAATALLGLASASARTIDRTASAFVVQAGRPGLGAEVWFNAQPILLVLAVPAVLMGLSFPLANALIQRAERSVGTRAGVLYLANTAGGVAGSLGAGFALLPALGIQRTATVLALVAASAALPLYFASGGARRAEPGRLRALATSLLVSTTAIWWWFNLPSTYVLSRALLFPLPLAYAVSEGVTELVAVTDGPDGGRVLVTNGHPMSSTELASQRYMRAMAHLPLLLADEPTRVLVMCFGVGNTVHAATLHPSVRRVEVVDLSRHILEHASYFRDVNRDVLQDPRVQVYVNDGRQHLQMEPAGSYDLITLEPPPIMHAGVAALYSTEFYERARARLSPRGYVSQWLPAFGVPQATILSMARAFLDVFPNAVLLSGASSNFILLGSAGADVRIDPARLAAALAHAPAVQDDLARLDLKGPREIVGMFTGSTRTLADATRGVVPVSDDRPIQEYARRSLIDNDEGVPPSIVDVGAVASWCPACFANGEPVPLVDGLDTYLALMKLAYTAPRIGVAQTVPSGARGRTIAGSGYLGSIVPDSPQLQAVITEAFTRRYQRGTDLLEQRHYQEAADQLREALLLAPDAVQAHNNLGIALASQGQFDEAIDHFRRALALQPDFDDARRNLEFAVGGR